MKRVIIFSVLFFTINFLNAQESGEIIITEILYDPASTDNSQNQYIELVNTTGNTINVNDWVIGDEDGSNTLPDINIPGFGILVICGCSALDMQNAFGSNFSILSLADIGQTMFTLANSPSLTNEIIELKDDLGNTIDIVNYEDGNGWPPNSNGFSIYLDLQNFQMNSISNNDGNNWKNSIIGTDGAFESSIFGSWNANEVGSPGNINGDQSLPVELTSFSATGFDDAIFLKWSTASEIDNQGFIIERSTQRNGAYQQLDSYKNNDALRGAGTTSHENFYEYNDYDVIQGLTYWYRLVDEDISGVQTTHGPVSAKVDDHLFYSEANRIPGRFSLHQNHPNPFNPSTKISFEVPALDNGPIALSLHIYNLMGQKVATIFNDVVDAGSYTAVWDGLDYNGSILPSGIYIYRIESDYFVQSRRMLLLK